MKSMFAGLIANAMEQSIERTCVNCGEIDVFCKCDKFQNFKDKYGGGQDGEEKGIDL